MPSTYRCPDYIALFGTLFLTVSICWVWPLVCEEEGQNRTVVSKCSDSTHCTYGIFSNLQKCRGPGLLLYEHLEQIERQRLQTLQHKHANNTQEGLHSCQNILRPRMGSGQATIIYTLQSAARSSQMGRI